MGPSSFSDAFPSSLLYLVSYSLFLDIQPVWRGRTMSWVVTQAEISGHPHIFDLCTLSLWATTVVVSWSLKHEFGLYTFKENVKSGNSDYGMERNIDTSSCVEQTLFIIASHFSTFFGLSSLKWWCVGFPPKLSLLKTRKWSTHHCVLYRYK